MSAPIYTGGNPFVRGGIRTKFKVIPSASAAVQITRSQSNSQFLFDRAGGLTYTLPSAVPGLTFQFNVTVSSTATTYKVITKNATEFLVGVAQGYNNASSLAALAFSGDGTTHIAVAMPFAGSQPAGGIQGTAFSVTCMTAGLWLVDGFFIAGTAFTTPFSAS